MTGFALGPGQGPAYDFHGAGVVIKASGGDTLGQLAVMESAYPAGLSVRPHVHAGEDEMFYLLDGELSGVCGEDRWTATPGTFVFVPRDCVHGYHVAFLGAAAVMAAVALVALALPGATARPSGPDRRAR